jgi:hypothetical protein
MAKSKYLARKLLDHVLGVQAYPMPATVYLALFTSVTGLEDGSLAHEVTAGGYARVAFAMPAAVDAESGGRSVSTASVDFAPATADWGAMQAWAVMDAATGGNVLHYGALPQYGDPAEYKKIWTGDGFRVRAGDLVISEK